MTNLFFNLELSGASISYLTVPSHMQDDKKYQPREGSGFGLFQSSHETRGILDLDSRNSGRTRKRQESSNRSYAVEFNNRISTTAEHKSKVDDLSSRRRRHSAPVAADILKALNLTKSSGQHDGRKIDGNESRCCTNNKESWKDAIGSIKKLDHDTMSPISVKKMVFRLKESAKRMGSLPQNAFESILQNLGLPPQEEENPWLQQVKTLRHDHQQQMDQQEQEDAKAVPTGTTDRLLHAMSKTILQEMDGDICQHGNKLRQSIVSLNSSMSELSASTAPKLKSPPQKTTTNDYDECSDDYAEESSYFEEVVEESDSSFALDKPLSVHQRRKLGSSSHHRRSVASSSNHFRGIDLKSSSRHFIESIDVAPECEEFYEDETVVDVEEVSTKKENHLLNENSSNYDGERSSYFESGGSPVSGADADSVGSGYTLECESLSCRSDISLSVFDENQYEGESEYMDITVHSEKPQTNEE